MVVWLVPICGHMVGWRRAVVMLLWVVVVGVGMVLLGNDGRCWRVTLAPRAPWPTIGRRPWWGCVCFPPLVSVRGHVWLGASAVRLCERKAYV